MPHPIQGTSVRLSGVSVEAITFDDGDGDKIVARSFVQIARYGEYKGHPQGEFVFDAPVFAQITGNFARLKMAGAVPFDHNHSSELPSSLPDVGDHAVGWIMELQDRAEAGLWAFVEWVDAVAVAKIRAKQLKFVSPAITFRAFDRESGEEIGAVLTSAALTNRPFLLGMAEVTATDHPFLDGMEPLTASDRPVTASLSPEAVHVPAAIAVVPTPKPKRPPMDEAQMKAAADMAAKYTALAARVCKLADLDPEAGEDAALEQLEKKVADMKKAQAAEAASMADRAVKSGRAPEAARAKLTALCLSDRDTFEALYPAPAATADATLMSARVAPQGGQAPATVEPPAQPERHTDAAHEGAVKLMAADKSLTYSAALVESSRALRDGAMASVLNSMKGAV